MVHGKGKFYHADGDIFEGEWKNDLYHGKGKQFFPEGTDVDLTKAEGDFFEGDAVIFNFTNSYFWSL